MINLLDTLHVLLLWSTFIAGVAGILVVWGIALAGERYEYPIPAFIALALGFHFMAIASSLVLF
jgi:hypothetical protein